MRIDRLREIANACTIPFVLHGGSGTPDDQMKNAIENGICKINIYSDVVTALNNGLKNKLNSVVNPAMWPMFVFEEARFLMRKTIRNKIRVFGSNNRV